MNAFAKPDPDDFGSVEIRRESRIPHDEAVMVTFLIESLHADPVPIPDKCCGEAPELVTHEGTGDWEGIVCYKCGRTVYGSPKVLLTVAEWNHGLDDR